jgi:hypothetical protein
MHALHLLVVRYVALLPRGPYLSWLSFDIKGALQGTMVRVANKQQCQ